jgi:spore coat polysaccharide biosynthesis protein SpsF
MTKIIGIIQARMGSTRLPGKTMTEIDGKPFLEHVIKSIRLSKKLNKIVIATSDNPKDDIIEKFAIEKNIPFFRGSEKDVLDRFYKTAKKYDVDFIVRLCADNLFLNFQVMDEMIDTALKEKYGYVNDVYGYPTPNGIVSEVLSMKALEIMWKNAKEEHQREHITQYIIENPEKFKIKNFEIPKWLQRKDIRLTLDTKKDLELLKILYTKFYKNKDKYDLKEIIEFLDKNPEIKNINMEK